MPPSLRAANPPRAVPLNDSLWPLGHNRSDSFRSDRPASFKRMLGIRAERALLALTDVPTDTCQVNQIDFPPPRMLGRAAESNTRIGSIKTLLRNDGPPSVE